MRRECLLHQLLYDWIIFWFFQSSSNIYKLTGPVLVKQDLEESKETVSKRINYISAEIKRQETAISGLEKDQDKHKENLAKLQTKLSAPARA